MQRHSAWWWKKYGHFQLFASMRLLVLFLLVLSLQVLGARRGRGGRRRRGRSVGRRTPAPVSPPTFVASFIGYSGSGRVNDVLGTRDFQLDWVASGGLGSSFCDQPVVSTSAVQMGGCFDSRAVHRDPALGDVPIESISVNCEAFPGTYFTYSDDNCTNLIQGDLALNGCLFADNRDLTQSTFLICCGDGSSFCETSK